MNSRTFAKLADEPILSVQPDTGFHFAEGERHLIHPESKLIHAGLVKEEQFLLQMKFAAQPDAANEPDLDFVLEREIEPAGEFGGGQLARGLPARVTLALPAGVEIKFTLRIHFAKQGCRPVEGNQIADGRRLAANRPCCRSVPPQRS